MIVRVANRARFVVVDQAVVDDARLSYRDRGLLIHLLGRPDNWSVRAESLATDADGKHAVRASLAKLEEFGYLVRTKARDEHGQWANHATIYESPEAALNATNDESPGGTTSDSPEPDKRAPEKPAPVKRAPVKRNKIQKPSSDHVRNADSGQTGSGETGSGKARPITNTETTKELPEAVPAPVAPRTARQQREEQARDITQRYWEWVKEQTKHDPPDNFMGLKAIVEAALTAHFEPGQITRGLAKCRGEGRTITRTTLWSAMSNLQPASKPGPGPANAWIDDAAAANKAWRDDA